MRLKDLVTKDGCFPIEGSVNFESRKISLDYPSEINDHTIFSKLFNSDFAFLQTNPSVNIAITISDNTKYFLNNLAVSFTFTGSKIKNFRFSKFDYAISNSINSLDNQTFTSYIARHTFHSHSAALISHLPLSFDFESYTIEIKRSQRKDLYGRVLPPFLTITICSKGDTYENLLDVYQLVLDTLTIILGKTPVYIDTVLTSEFGTHEIHRDLIEKYNNKELSFDYAISKLNQENFNAELLSNINSFKKTRLTLSMFLLHN